MYFSQYLVSSTKLPNIETSLKLLQVAYRHGDRSPIFVYPTNKNLNYWSQYGGLGQLTQTG